jgi:hypothetical protein
MASITNLPTNIIYHIWEFFTVKSDLNEDYLYIEEDYYSIRRREDSFVASDWRNFMNTTLLFHEIKIKTIHLKLSRFYSKRFIENKKNFRLNVLSRIVLPGKQLSLILEERAFFTPLPDTLYISSVSTISICIDTTQEEFYKDEETENHIYSATFSNLSSFSIPSSVQIMFEEIVPIRFSLPTDFSHPQISFFSIDIILNEKSFSAISKIPFQFASMLIIRSVTPSMLSLLENIPNLTIYYTIEEIDLSKFQKLETLTLVDCPGLVKFNSLPFPSLKLITLSLCGETSKMKDLTLLQNLESVYLFEWEGINVNPLRDVKEVRLEFCSNISDISSLGNVKTLEIMYCRNIYDLTGLTNVLYLSLKGSFNITDLSPLCSVRILDICGLRHLEKGYHAIYMPYLREISFDSFVSMEFLKKVNENHILRNIIFDNEEYFENLADNENEEGQNEENSNDEDDEEEDEDDENDVEYEAIGNQNEQGTNGYHEIGLPGAFTAAGEAAVNEMNQEGGPPLNFSDFMNYTEQPKYQKHMNLSALSSSFQTTAESESGLVAGRNQGIKKLSLFHGGITDFSQFILFNIIELQLQKISFLKELITFSFFPKLEYCGISSCPHLEKVIFNHSSTSCNSEINLCKNLTIVEITNQMNEISILSPSDDLTVIIDDKKEIVIESLLLGKMKHYNILTKGKGKIINLNII